MSYLIPESDLQIFEFNRLVKDLNGLTKEEFLIRLDTVFRIENRGSEYYKPTKKHHFRERSVGGVVCRHTCVPKLICECSKERS